MLTRNEVEPVRSTCPECDGSGHAR
jgi:hypothetical protein